MAKNNLFNTGRYRGLIISIIVFLLLVASFLVFTIYSTQQLARYDALLNVANKISLDQQSVVKDLFDLQNSQGEDISSPHYQTVTKRLKQASEDISANLEAVRSGGIGIEPSGDRKQMPNVNNSQTSALIDESKSEWERLNPKIDDFLAISNDITKDASSELAVAVEQGKTSSLSMTDSFQNLNQNIRGIVDDITRRIQLAQLLAIAVMLGYLVFFVFISLRRLRTADAEAIEARRETEEILETVNTGLFLLDKDLNIGNQHSKALESILGTDRLAGEKFDSVLRNRISEKDLETTRQFIEQLYNPRVKSKLVNDLNPLNKVNLYSDSGEGLSNRFLDFKFSRVYEDKDIARILVNVQDVSDSVLLEQRLEKERAQNDMQIEMLTTILNVNPQMISDFIVNTKAHIERMNNILKNPGSSQIELEGKLKSLYREMHSLKGESSALKLHSFTKIATDAEDKLQALQSQGKLSGNDFLPLAVHLDDLLSLSHTIESLGERISSRVTSSADHVNKPSDPTMATDTKIAEPSRDKQQLNHATQEEALQIDVDLDDEPASNKNITHDSNSSASTHDQDSAIIQYYQNFAHDIAERQGKQVNVEVVGFNNTEQLPKAISKAIQEISVQLVRNAIVHGIESPENRKSSFKPAKGNIVLKLSQETDDWLLSVEDDGVGINYNEIRDTLLKSEKYSPEQIAKLTKPQLLNVLFSSGFSTKATVDEDAGRGIGLDIIKSRTKEMGGKLNVHSEHGRMTRFTVKFPKHSS